MRKKLLFTLIATLAFAVVSIASADSFTNDIVIDGLVSDWDNGVGIDVCVADEGGYSDQPWEEGNIEGFCVAHNLIDTLYFMTGSKYVPRLFVPIVDLFGYKACIVIDVPPNNASQSPDGVYDFELCQSREYCLPGTPFLNQNECDSITLDNFAELSCLSSTVCASTIPINSVTQYWAVPLGPFGQANYDEFPVAYQDLGIQLGDTICTQAYSGPHRDYPDDYVYNDINDELCYTLSGSPTSISLQQIQTETSRANMNLSVLAFLLLSLWTMGMLRKNTIGRRFGRISAE